MHAVLCGLTHHLICWLAAAIILVVRKIIKWNRTLVGHKFHGLQDVRTLATIQPYLAI